jgi:hypothetical protein
MSAEEVNGLLDDIAIIASGINHAVDAQKTYALEELPNYIKKRYGFKTWSEQFKNPNGDWDRSKMRQMRHGSVDRLIANIQDIIPTQIDFDTHNMRFDWKMLKDTDSSCIKAVRASTVSQKILDVLSTYHPAEGTYDEMLLQQIREGEKVTFYRFMRLMYHANTAFYERYKEIESDAIAQIRADHMRIDITRNIAVDFVRKSFNETNMEYDKALRIAAWSMLADTFNERWNGKNEKYARFIFDVFGDIYAENVRKNIAAGVTVSSEDEFDAYVIAEQNNFDPDAYDVPMTDDYSVNAMLYNELDDVY